MTETDTKASPKRSAAQRKRRRRRIVRVIVAALLLVALAFAGVWYYNDQQKKAADENAVSYVRAPVRSGEFSVTVYGSGMVQAASQPNVIAQTEGTVTALRVGPGDPVKAGQVLAVLENKALTEEIRELEYDLWELDSTITTTTATGEVTSIQAPSAGRVMKIYARPGDDALAIYRQHGSVAILSTDGRMKVGFAVAEGAAIALGEMVTIVGDGYTREATVTELYMQGTQATVTVLDDTLPMDDAVTVQNAQGEAIGKGTLQINKPMAVSAFGGTIRDVRVREGDSVPQKYVLFTLKDAPNSLELENLRMQREAAADSLQTAVDSRENLIVTAPVDGVVASVSVEQGSAVKSGDLLASILEGEEMVLTIAVDELDVVQVEPGQNVQIAIDALPDLALVGEVDKIAPVGSGSGGVTTYDVMLNFSAAGTGVRAGMNASGEIRVAYEASALYIPVEALMTIGDMQYVLVSGSGAGGMSFAAPQQMAEGGAERGERPSRGSSSTAEGGEGRAMMMQVQAQQPSAAGEGEQETEMRQVTTGLVNDSYVQILSGLGEGEIVLYQSADSSGGGGMYGGMSMMGGTAVRIDSGVSMRGN